MNPTEAPPSSSITSLRLQINLMLCIWTLLLKTRERLGHYSLLHHLDKQLQLSRFLGRSFAGGWKRGGQQRHEPIASPAVHRGLHSALHRARTSLDRRHSDQESQEAEQHGHGDDVISIKSSHDPTYGLELTGHPALPPTSPASSKRRRVKGPRRAS